MDWVFLEGLEVPCQVGCTDDEQEVPQSLKVDIRMGCGTLEEAGRSDRIDATLDYRIARRFVQVVQLRKFRLIEAVAETIAQEALHLDQVEIVEVTVRKRAPIPSLGMAGVTLTRTRKT